MAETLRDMLRNRTSVIDLAVEDASTGADKPESVQPKPKPKPKEVVGTGVASFDLEAAIAKLRERIKASSDVNLKAKLEARIKALKDNQ